MTSKWKRGMELWELYDTGTGCGHRRGTKDAVAAMVESANARYATRPGQYAMRRVR
jgi:hypothetical protein